MNEKQLLVIGGFFFFILFAKCGSAQDFVYKPINTSFGGDAYNMSWMLNSASEQNKLKEEDDQYGYGQNNPLDDFEDNLNRQILNELSRRLVDKIFGGTGDLESGTYRLGNYEVDVFEDGSGVNVDIQDMSNGNFTSVQIPYY